MRQMQLEMGRRALDLLELPKETCLFSTSVVEQVFAGSPLERDGHIWVGTDLSSSMLEVATRQRGRRADVLVHDMGHGLPFLKRTFDAAISISALQWLCYHAEHHSKSLSTDCAPITSAAAAKGGRAICSFTPSPLAMQPRLQRCSGVWFHRGCSRHPKRQQPKVLLVH